MLATHRALRCGLLTVLALSLSACGGIMPSPSAPVAAAPVDPTPLAKCQIAASASSPLVTEWPASEKAHLQSLLASQTVAVEYSGCELRIIDSCSLPGNYAWRRTTLATDTVEIENADELYAKLPIGAVGLEGELQRSGRLAVRTTVAGQLTSQGMTAAAAEDPSCAEATHYISGISVGAFQLLSGSSAAGGGRVDVAIAKAGGRASRRELVLREAGSSQACSEATDEAPSSQCASPIQVFLRPLAPAVAKRAPGTVTEEDIARAAAVNIAFPAPDDSDEVWTLRAPGGHIVCTLPCESWVGPVSGYYLQREPRNGVSQAVLHLPQSFPHRPGSRATAEYQAERGNPALARWVFYGSIPVGLTGVGLTIWGVVQATRTCRDTITREEEDCFPPAGFLIGVGAVWTAMGVAGAWWHFYSHEERFNTYEDLAASENRATNVSVNIGPGFVTGTF